MGSLTLQSLREMMKSLLDSSGFDRVLDKVEPGRGDATRCFSAQLVLLVWPERSPSFVTLNDLL